MVNFYHLTHIEHPYKARSFPAEVHPSMISKLLHKGQAHTDAHLAADRDM